MKTYFLVIDENQKILIEYALKNMKKDAEDQRTTGFAKHEIVHFSLPELERRMQLMQVETFIGKLIEDVVGAEEFGEVEESGCEYEEKVMTLHLTILQGNIVYDSLLESFILWEKTLRELPDIRVNSYLRKKLTERIKEMKHNLMPLVNEKLTAAEKTTKIQEPKSE